MCVIGPKGALKAAVTNFRLVLMILKIFDARTIENFRPLPRCY